MKNLFFALYISLFVTANANAGFFAWGTQVKLAKMFKCKSKPCTGTSLVPDKVTAKKVALTFDDGPSSQLTPKVLEILKITISRRPSLFLGKM